MSNNIKNEKFKKVALILTTACNMRCKYCFESGQGYCGDFMSDETIRQSIKKTLYNTEDVSSNIIIELFGGEPTLSEKQIKITYDSIKEYNIHNKKINVWITTNLFKYNENIINIMKESKIPTKITVSILFDKESHDADRVDISGNGTYDSVRANLDRLILDTDDSLITIQCHQVFSPKIIRMKTLGKILEESIMIMSKNRKLFVSTSPVSQGSTDEDQYSDEDIRYIIYEFNNAIEENSIFLGSIPEDFMAEFAGHWLAKSLVHQRQDKMFFCQDLNRHITVGVDGKTHMCHRMYLGSEMDEQKISSVYDDDIFKKHFLEYCNMIDKVTNSGGESEYEKGFLKLTRKSELGHDCSKCFAGLECHPCYVPMIGKAKDTKHYKDCIFARQKCYWKFTYDSHKTIEQTIFINNLILNKIKEIGTIESKLLIEQINVNNNILKDIRNYLEVNNVL